MKTVSHKKLYVRNPDTGEFEPLMAIRGESAYDIAVRLGKFTGTEEEWNNALEIERQAAVASIEAKGAETLASIPDDYVALAEEAARLEEDKFDKANIAQELGDSEEKVLSQKAASDAFGKQKDFFFDKISDNRVDPITMTDGYVNNTTGEVDTTVANYLATDFIDISGNNGFISAYYCTKDDAFYSVFFRGAFYDKNYTYVSGLDNNGKDMKAQENAIHEVPQNAKYVRVCYYKANIEPKYMLLLSDSVTPYTPYSFEKNKDIADEIQNSKKTWSGKTWVSYGDSITAVGNGTNSEGGWQYYVNERVGSQKCYGRGIGGQTFVYNKKPWFANADGSYNSRDDNGDMNDSASYTVPDGCTAHYGYHSSWDRIKTMISDDINDEIDLIFLFGVNDCWEWSSGDLTFEPPTFSASNTTDTAWANAPENVLGGDFDLSNFIGAVASTIMKLQARCPNAMIVFGTSWSGRSDSDTNANSAEYSNMGKWIWKEGELVKQIANYFSIPCVDIWARSGVNPFNRSEYVTDTIHPYCDKGKKALARAVIDGLGKINPRFDI
jgi:hypothetical protein